LSLKYLLCICLLGCLLLVIAPFLDLPVLETNTTFIGSYGAYLSGTVGPFIALFAFFGILQTLKIQQDQIKQLSIDSKKQEIIRCLEKLEFLIEEKLSNHQIPIEASGQSYSLYQVMTMIYFAKSYKQKLKCSEEYLQGTLDPYDLMIFESIGSAGLYMTRMSEYIKAYRKLSSENFVLSLYYNKYNPLAEKLHSLGYITQETYEFWENKLNK
jgi:hypothetical protein